ncbi:MAG TPA: preprotein translocase subunit SecE [Acidimicrobiales bacterium]|jgi:preprotein translocase subunit SecE|nr:preprotein translocase subunit SecE [Acidimicrobiales bacterium]
MNRQYKGATEAELVAAGGAPPTEAPPRRQAREEPSGPRRATPRQFLHEVNVEMRKVAWPTRASTINYSTVVFVTLAILMALIFGLDLAFSKISIFLFK